MIKPFSTQFNVAALHIASKLWPRWFDVSDDAPATLESLTREFATRRRITVWRGASDSTIFGGPECAEANWAFRAWHDYYHLTRQHSFTPAGERLVCLAQMDDIVTLYGATSEFSALARRLIVEEVIGQALYQERHGVFPSDQRGFAFSWLHDGAEAALEKIW